MTSENPINSNPSRRPAPAERTISLPSIDPVAHPSGASRPSEDAPEAYAPFVPAAKHTGGPQRGRVSKKPKSNRKMALSFAGVLFAVVLGIYLTGVFIFSDRFMPNTTVMGEDVSLKTSSEVQDILVDVAREYSLDVSGLGFSLTLASSDVGLGIDAKSVTDAMHKDANPWAWPVEIFKSRNESDKFATSNGKVDESVRKAVEAFNENAAAPKNAGLDYDDANDRFVVRTEVEGEALDVDKVVAAVDAAVADLQPTLVLTEDALQKPTLFADDPRLVQAEADANDQLEANFALKLADATVSQVNADLISGWVRLRDDVTIALDEEAIAGWVQEIASECNTYQARRSYTRADGKEINVSGGVYGWIVDKDALKQTVLDGIAADQTGGVAIPCEQEAGAYNGLHGRDWGPRYIDVDLTEQHARFYDEGGALVWESDVVTGTPDGEHDTPEGVYVINNKESPSKLIGEMKPETGEPEYKTEVQTWMPFVGNAIGFHDADWQSAFGGSRYTTGYGSHGCVNLPVDKSAQLYDLIQVGDVVVSHW